MKPRGRETYNRYYSGLVNKAFRVRGDEIQLRNYENIQKLNDEINDINYRISTQNHYATLKEQIYEDQKRRKLERDEYRLKGNDTSTASFPHLLEPTADVSRMNALEKKRMYKEQLDSHVKLREQRSRVNRLQEELYNKTYVNRVRSEIRNHDILSMRRKEEQNKFYRDGLTEERKMKKVGNYIEKVDYKRIMDPYMDMVKREATSLSPRGNQDRSTTPVKNKTPRKLSSPKLIKEKIKKRSIDKRVDNIKQNILERIMILKNLDRKTPDGMVRSNSFYK